jgi:hypothetical protein
LKGHLWEITRYCLERHLWEHRGREIIGRWVGGWASRQVGKWACVAGRPRTEQGQQRKERLRVDGYVEGGQCS